MNDTTWNVTVPADPWNASVPADNWGPSIPAEPVEPGDGLPYTLPFTLAA